MKHRTKSIPLEQEHQQALTEQTQKQSVRQFETVDELLRHDAAQMVVPPGVAKRLEQSIGQTSPPAKSWWRWLLGR